MTQKVITEIHEEVMIDFDRTENGKEPESAKQ